MSIKTIDDFIYYLECTQGLLTSGQPSQYYDMFGEAVRKAKHLKNIMEQTASKDRELMVELSMDYINKDNLQKLLSGEAILENTEGNASKALAAVADIIRKHLEENPV